MFCLVTFTEFNPDYTDGLAVVAVSYTSYILDKPQIIRQAKEKLLRKYIDEEIEKNLPIESYIGNNFFNYDNERDEETPLTVEEFFCDSNGFFGSNESICIDYVVYDYVAYVSGGA